MGAAIQRESLKGGEVFPSGVESRKSLPHPLLRGGEEEVAYLEPNKHWTCGGRAVVTLHQHGCHPRCGMKIEWVGKKYSNFHPSATRLLLYTCWTTSPRRLPETEPGRCSLPGPPPEHQSKAEQRRKGAPKWEVCRTIGFCITRVSIIGVQRTELLLRDYTFYPLWERS